MTATNKRLLKSESHSDSNRCTPCRGKPDHHIGPRTPSTRFLRVVHVRGNLSWVVNRLWAGPLLPRKWAPDTIHSTSADRSMGPYPVSLPSQPMKQSGQSQVSINDKLLGLLGPYHQHEIGTFNTCSRGPTHQSLTDTGGGYNLGGASFPHTTPQPSQPVVSPFHLRAPPGLQFNQTLSTKPRC
jgi:hypothetical protein